MKPTNRLLSLDVFRGATVALMTLVNNPGDWGHIYAPLEHAEWNGCTPTDCVFPFFLFIVGVSISFSLQPDYIQETTYQKIFVRTLKLFLLGLFLNFFSKINIGIDNNYLLLGVRLLVTFSVTTLLLGSYDNKTELRLTLLLLLLMLSLAFFSKNFEKVRIPGVLQRIALVYFFVSMIYLKTSSRMQAAILIFILIAYWLLMTKVPVPNGMPANLEKTTNLAAWLDNLLLHGHLWISTKVWDPEGILSTLPAIGTGLIGLLAGTWLQSNKSRGQRAIGLLLFGAIGIVFGMLWHEIFPVNKALWTSSFVLYTAGWALIVLGILYWIIDIKEKKGWTFPFALFGINAIVVFFFSGIIPRVLNMIKIPVLNGKERGLQLWLYEKGIAPFFNEPRNASLAGALVYLMIWAAILGFMYRRKYIFKV